MPALSRSPYPLERVIIKHTSHLRSKLALLLPALDNALASGNTDQASVLRETIKHIQTTEIPYQVNFLKVARRVCSSVQGTQRVDAVHWNGVLRWHWLTSGNQDTFANGHLAEGRAQVNVIDVNLRGAM